ncbi:MAG: 6-pyruvoyl-tetrahydropterin synthase-related protein [Candidatus Sulfotelmatobacter sp.]
MSTNLTPTKAGEDGSSIRPPAGARSRLTWMPLLAVAAAAFAVEIPFFFRGTPSGHDVEFHLYTWLEVLSQWRQGTVYPRWAALAHFGYGEPRFIFYPSGSWTLGAALSTVFPWTLAASIYIWIVLAGAGASMFLLARRWFDRRDATFAAVLYAVNPYHLVIVYWRSAFAELLASSLLPLLLLLLLRADSNRRRTTILLALLLGCSWLINAPAAVMIHYSLALLLVVVAWQRRSPSILFAGAVAVALAAALASFYLLPAIYEQRFVDIGQAVSAGARPADNFLFVHTADAEHDAFNRVISWIAVAEIMITIAATWAARGWRRRSREVWYSLVVWAGVCGVLMLSISNPLWEILPKLRFMQFPWRWLLCLGVPFTLLIAIGVRRWTSRVALYLAMLCVVAFVWQHFQPPWWDNAADLREIQDNVATGVGYEGTDEYTPLGADPSAVDRGARRVTVEGAAHAAIRVFEWKAERKVFTAEISAADNLVLHLFNYPAWRVEVNGHQVQAGTREGTGQMLVPVDAGDNRVQITFGRTWDRTTGAWISGLALLLSFGLLRKTVPSSA